MGGRSAAQFASDAGITRQALSLILKDPTRGVRAATLAGLVRAGVRLSPRLLQSLAA